MGDFLFQSIEMTWSRVLGGEGKLKLSSARRKAIHAGSTLGTHGTAFRAHLPTGRTKKIERPKTIIIHPHDIENIK